MNDLNPNVRPTQGARDWLAWLQYKFSPLEIDRMVEKVAFQEEAALKAATPKRWFGQVRNGWHTTKPQLEVRVVSNSAVAANGAPIMLFLEEGTANNGTGFIYPTKAKKLYVPLNRKAAGGWRPGLVYGKDYVLKDKVRGQKGQHIVANERPKAMALLKAGMMEVVENVLRREGMTHAPV